MSADKEQLFTAGVALAEEFCRRNRLVMPLVTRLTKQDRLYHLATCAYYRPQDGIVIMVEKCANRGYGGRAWSWPAYKIDRTPYGVMQHELGHHVDFQRSPGCRSPHFSFRIHEMSKEPPLTGYLGTGFNRLTYYMEWFAENFRLFVTNPHLCAQLRPKFYAAMLAEKFVPVVEKCWEDVFTENGAPRRITDMANRLVDSMAGGGCP
jgi:hypothetical protein